MGYNKAIAYNKTIRKDLSYSTAGSILELAVRKTIIIKSSIWNEQDGLNKTITYLFLMSKYTLIAHLGSI